MSRSRFPNQQIAKTNSQGIAHVLIGTPGSGKSTFAKLLSNLGNYEIISTDNIRAELYGDPAIQGEWQTIETTVINRICTIFRLGKSVIYDATNYKRCFRMDFLRKTDTQLAEWKLTPPDWIGWYLQTPLLTCMKWNEQRQRQVPAEIIESMYNILQDFPPVIGEGFATVNKIDVTAPEFSPHQVTKLIADIPRQIINFQNRHGNITPHPYSQLLDFERLMYLIFLIINYPGIGKFHLTQPQFLQNLLGYVPELTNSIAEITAIMAKLVGGVYAQSHAIAADLQWLATQGIINSTFPLVSQNRPECNSYEWQSFHTLHSYSDKQVFERLIGTIRFILHYPFLPNTGGGSLETLTQSLAQAGVIYHPQSEKATIRKDIEKVLKPYRILAGFPMRNGYFAGTGILSKSELIKVFDIIQSQANSLNDPQALVIYETFKQRLLQTHIIDNTENIYPVRAIANSSIVDPKHLHSSALSNQPELETAIIEGRLLELKRLAGVGKYQGDEQNFFLAYPLQIVFSNLAWYLGYECVSGETPGLLRFERLDRLFLARPQTQQRTTEAQEKSLKKLHNLLKASAGMHLGNSATDQQQFLSADQQKRLGVCVTVELWFNDQVYPFITEGTKRFAHMKMSPPVHNTRTNLPKSLFSLTRTGDRHFPHRFQAIFPQWTLNDFDLWRWILGFGGNVKVVAPQELVTRVKEIAQGIVANYDS